jgi:hypothetical protein
MATYSPSKITKDGNTYNFTDTTKIPLAGTNALAGSIVPDTDNAYILGDSSYGFANIYTKYVQGSNAQKELSLFSSNNAYDPWNHGASLSLFTNDYSDYPDRTGTFSIQAKGSGDNACILKGTPSGTLTWGSKNVAMQEDVVPRSGGAVMTGNDFSRTVDNERITIRGGSGYDKGAQISLYGNASVYAGTVYLHPSNGNTDWSDMYMYSNGTWTWTGTACQITSDQRLKQQITEIDNKLLDAWEDVDLVQFKYNDAVDQKKDKARLHTGYVVQQIDKACKSHNVDISEYGLYCHEVYQEETEEVEVEQADGTKTKETKVIREASEHYSLRYTEALIIECAYLRKCIKELRNEIEQLKSSK